MSLGSASIFDDIEAGFWDGDGLDAIIEAAVARRKAVRDMQGARNKANFNHGERVRLINIKPRYLIGIEGTINKLKTPSRNGDLSVDIDPRFYHRLGRYSRSGLSIPASSLELV